MQMLALLPALLLTFAGGAERQAGPIAGGGRLWTLTTDDSDPNGGAVVALRGGPRWRAQKHAATDGGRILRRFGRNLFAVNTGAGTVQRVALGRGTVQDYDIGVESAPQDIHALPALAPRRAYVTRRFDPFLLELDLVTGALHDALDLSPVGGGAPIALGTMERDGSRLFVQVRVEDGGTRMPGEAHGVLAVVDLVTEQLIDVDPLAPGTQGIALAGAPPRLKMQIVAGTRTLFVSATESLLDERGGIEMVDLDALASVGFALSEETGGSDIGGFVMTSPEEGYYVFHTDIVASTHLKHFTIASGPDPGFEIVTMLGDTVDAIAHDPARRAIYLPTGFSWGTPGLHAVSTETNEVVGPLIDTLLRPHDVLVVY
jgi:hypothetical protein